MKQEKSLYKISVGDWAYFEEWWDKKDVWAQVIKTEMGCFTIHFQLWFPDKELEKENQDDSEWFRLKHIDKCFEEK